MKKSIYFKIALLCIMSLIITFNSKVVFAEGTAAFNAKAEVTGEIKKGNTIDIVINTDKIDSIYAADIYLKYDNSLLKITSMEKGDVFSDKSIKTFEVVNKFDNAAGTLRYEFTCLGKINGFSGSGSLIKVKAEVLKDGKFIINSKPYLKNPDENYNLKLQIADKNIKELNFNFTPYGITNEAQPKNNSSDTTLNANTVDNSKDDTIKNSGTAVTNNTTNNTKTDNNNQQVNSQENTSGKSETANPQSDISSFNKMIILVLLGAAVLIAVIYKKMGNKIFKRK